MSNRAGVRRPLLARGDDLADRLLRIRNIHEADSTGYCSVCKVPCPCPTSLIAAGAE